MNLQPKVFIRFSFFFSSEKGREKDVAIFSCVRANDKGEIGFLSNSRRMNVGITRAKSSVLVRH